MDFFKLLQSLDEMLYEVVSWLLFYPLTMWRVIRSPVEMMKSADRELNEAERKQFDDAISPPIFLLLTVLLAHMVELGIFGNSRLAMRNSEVIGLVGNETNLTIFRIVSLSILPLMAALRLIRARGSSLDREALKAPFYAQCYVAALFALLMTVALAAAGTHEPLADLRFLTIAGFALLWLYVIEAHWFAAKLQTSIGRGFRQATILMGQWLILLVGFFFLVS